MPTVPVLGGKDQATLELSSVFGGPARVPLVHQAVVRELAARRTGTHDTKGRSEVSGGGRKPWKQKGTGRARQGSIRASHWVGGGKAMAPKARDYTYRPPRKVRQGAIRVALSLKAKDKKLIVLDAFPVSEAKTKAVFEVLTKRLKLTNALVVDEKGNDKLLRSVRNMAKFDAVPPEGVNLESLLKHEALVLTSKAAKALEGALS